MKNPRMLLSRAAAITVACALATGSVVLAQQPAPQPAAPAAGQTQPSGTTFTQKDMDELLAPIALYPDALLAQVFMASTYPLEVVEAARWQKQNATLKDKALEDAVAKQTWDESVKALTAVPQVLTMMNEKLDWTTKLGDAFLAQQEAMLKTVQTLRKKADEAGNLKTSEEMKVSKETENNVQVIKIESPKPETVYVPTYNPATVYGTWWYPAPPPYYYYPPGYAYGAGLAFASGVFWGAAIAGGIGWGNNEININRNTNINTGNRNNIQGGNKWQHNPEHRKGAAYRDSGTAQKYNRGGDRAASQSREQFRGRADQGRSDLSSMDRGQLNNSISQADRASGNRGGGERGGGAGGGDRGGGGGNFGGGGGGNRGGGGASASQRSGGFSGAGGGGASTRAASSRGGASRGGGGGGRGGGRR
jgi:hypothetical protein